MGKFIDLTGDKFGILTVVEICGKNRHNQYYWKCKCDCGNDVVVLGHNLRNGTTKSCGCVMKSKHRTFGRSRTMLYRCWNSMRQRCFCEKTNGYLRYGGRGITVCDEWKNDFQAFYDWAIANGYKDGLSIDRIDVNGNYEPSNCRWITFAEQSNNRRTNHYITYNGETKTISEWAQILGMNYNTLRARIRCGWDIERAFSKK